MLSVSPYTYDEVIRQPYSDCTFSAGFVDGHAVDTLYLKFERDGAEPTIILLRPDEAAALAWCLTGALWSERMRLDERREQPASSHEEIADLAGHDEASRVGCTGPA